MTEYAIKTNSVSENCFRCQWDVGIGITVGRESLQLITEEPIKYEGMGLMNWKPGELKS